MEKKTLTEKQMFPPTSEILKNLSPEDGARYLRLSKDFVGVHDDASWIGESKPQGEEKAKELSELLRKAGVNVDSPVRE